MVTFTYKRPFAHLPLWDVEDYERFNQLWQLDLIDRMRRALANTTFIAPLEIPGRGKEADDR